MRLFRHGTCDSTSERAFATLAEGQGQHEDVHLATAQTAGRGRRGRSWWSPEGEGLYASVIWSPKDAPEPAALTMAGGLAALDVARGAGLDGAWLDWPNDLMVADRKLAGVLVEARGLDPSSPTYVLGVGINVAQRAFPEALTAERGVTSLALEGGRADLEETERRLLAALQAWLPRTTADPVGLAAAFLEATGLLGSVVCVEGPDGELRGELVALDLRQGVVLDTPEGQVATPLAHVRGVTPVGPRTADSR